MFILLEIKLSDMDSSSCNATWSSSFPTSRNFVAKPRRVTAEPGPAEPFCFTSEMPCGTEWRRTQRCSHALYEGTTSAEATAQLSEAGFNERWFSQAYRSWQGIECCGEYDAALARATDLDSGQVLVGFSAADRDGQAVWPFFLLVGLGVGFIGWVIICLPKQRTLPLEEVSEPELVA